ncbi:TMEM175 family protein [uncultured Acetobacteroides sp.]|uniref:TMEM175 family protein n=1 Tax=uncultured Acetobacteroides sp. TaxID=1760811 RepID=UPI0029F56D98|nr:TMEM175 family protein [uncultured Acetobacteroides sp.]
MDKNRLEAFSDGVMAIIITIMVLEFKVPHDTSWESLWNLWPVFLSYALSFVFVGLYWSSHHHLFHMAERVNNRILWSNMLGLFFLSFTPFATAWMGENTFNSQTVTLYAVILSLCVVSYLLLVHQLRALHGYDSKFSKTFKGYTKIFITISLNSLAALIAFFGYPRIAFILLILTSLAWFIPNHRYENHITDED